MGDASGLGFGSVFWGQGKIVSKSGELTTMYQGRLSKNLEGDNLINRIDESVASGELEGV